MDIDLNYIRENVKFLFIATPLYDGGAKVNYLMSMIKLTSALTQYGIPFVYYPYANESLIQRARNYCANVFLSNDKYTHFMFIDGDVGFEPIHVIELLYFNIKYGDTNIMSGVYPKKTIAWEKVVEVINRGIIDEKEPNILADLSADFVLNLKPGKNEVDLSQPIEVMETGTGFMLTHRKTFDKIKSDNPNISYLPDHSRVPGFDGSKEIDLFFDCKVDPESRRYLSEDYYFCRLAGKSGIKTYVLPSINLTHMGSHIYKGNFIEMAKLGLSITHNKKEKNKK